MATMVGMEQAFELAVEEFISQRMDDIEVNELYPKHGGKESEYNEVFKKKSRLKVAFVSTLDQSQKDVFFIIEDLTCDMASINLRSTYRCGAMDAFAIFRLFLEGGKDGEKKC